MKKIKNRSFYLFLLLLVVFCTPIESNRSPHFLNENDQRYNALPSSSHTHKALPLPHVHHDPVKNFKDLSKPSIKDRLKKLSAPIKTCIEGATIGGTFIAGIALGTTFTAIISNIVDNDLEHPSPHPLSHMVKKEYLLQQPKKPAPNALEQALMHGSIGSSVNYSISVFLQFFSDFPLSLGLREIPFHLRQRNMLPAVMFGRGLEIGLKAAALSNICSLIPYTETIGDQILRIIQKKSLYPSKPKWPLQLIAHSGFLVLTTKFLKHDLVKHWSNISS